MTDEERLWFIQGFELGYFLLIVLQTSANFGLFFFVISDDIITVSQLIMLRILRKLASPIAIVSAGRVLGHVFHVTGHCWREFLLILRRTLLQRLCHSRRDDVGDDFRGRGFSSLYSLINGRFFRLGLGWGRQNEVWHQILSDLLF